MRRAIAVWLACVVAPVTAQEASLTAGQEQGRKLFQATCAYCHGEKVWGRFGFVDAFNEARDWYADTYLAIDQGPIVVMIENHRTGLLWDLFMKAPEIQAGLKALSFTR